MYEVASHIDLEPIKSLASAVVVSAVGDYRKAGSAGRAVIRREMENSFWLNLLDVDYDFTEIANIIDKEDSR